MQLLLNGVSAGLGLAILALGFALIYHSTQIFHIAHAAVFTVAGYTGYWAITTLGCGMIVAALVALVASCLVGLTLELLVYRPLAMRAAAPLVVLISSFGAYVTAVHLIALVAGTEAKALTSALLPPLVVGNWILTRAQAGQLAAGAAGIVTVAAYLHFSRAGRWTRAMASNRRLLLALGVNEPRLRTLVFLFGSLLAGIAGLLSALDIGIHPHMGFQGVLLAAVAAILAGPNRFMAAGWAALALGVGKNLLAGVVPATWTEAAVAALLLMSLLYRRNALVGRLSTIGGPQ